MTTPARTDGVEVVPIDSLVPDPDNARLHPEDNLDALRKSLTQFGQPEALVVQRSTNMVIAGNGRLEAMKSLGWRQVAVRLVDWDDRKARAYSVAANRTGELSTWDTSRLEAQLDDLKADYDLDGLGFDQDALDDLFDGNRGDDEVVEDDVPEPPAVATTQAGELWRLGDHLLLCGDARHALDALIAPGTADCVLTDPPYGVSYVGKTQDAMTIKGDGKEGLRLLLHEAFPNVMRACRPGATWYVCAPAGPQFLDFAQELTALEIWRQTIVWVKDVFVMGHSDYHYRHEVLFYGWVPGGTHITPPDRRQDTIWEIPRPKRSEEHPTMKPVELMARCLTNGTRPGAVVVEPFAGSGTTLIACEQMHRVCRAVEIDPVYCDVIIERWQNLTGRKAERVSDGRREEEGASDLGERPKRRRKSV